MLSYLDAGSLLTQIASFTLIKVSAYRMNFMASVSSSLKKGYYPSLWASQVAHGERICLPMHETQVQSVVLKIPDATEKLSLRSPSIESVL